MARGKYGVTFPIFEKIEINGENTHDVYKFLRMNAPELNQTEGQVDVIPWSWSKFLVDRNGMVRKFYPPIITVEEMKPDIMKLLKDDNAKL